MCERVIEVKMKTKSAKLWSGKAGFSKIYIYIFRPEGAKTTLLILSISSLGAAST